MRDRFFVPVGMTHPRKSLEREPAGSTTTGRWTW
jgi:hypothetical protein